MFYFGIPNRINANKTHRTSEVLHMKRIHRLDEREMELVKLLTTDCQSTGDIKAKLKKLFYRSDAGSRNGRASRL